MKAPQRPKALVPAGSFPARVYRIVYMGTIKGNYKGQPTEGPKVNITWELPTKTHIFKEGSPAEPFVVSKQVSHSMGKKSTLRKDVIEPMLGITFLDHEAFSYDLDEILGMTCLIGVAHKETPDGKRAEIKSFSQLPDRMVCPPAVNQPKILSYGNWDEEEFNKLAPWMKDEMVKTPEYKKMKGETVSDPTDELAF